MIFHQGGYSGFPQADAPQQHTVVDTTEDSVTVEFKDWEALDEAGGANVEAPNYTEEVTFRWVDGTVVTEGRIPNEPQKLALELLTRSPAPEARCPYPTASTA